MVLNMKILETAWLFNVAIGGEQRWYGEERASIKTIITAPYDWTKISTIWLYLFTLIFTTFSSHFATTVFPGVRNVWVPKFYFKSGYISMIRFKSDFRVVNFQTETYSDSRNHQFVSSALPRSFFYLILDVAARLRGTYRRFLGLNQYL